MQLFLLLFFYCLSLNADQIDLNKSKIDRAKEQQHIFGYRECCGNNIFWCKDALSQLMRMSISLGFVYTMYRNLTFNGRQVDGQVTTTVAPSFSKCVTIASVALLYPYVMRYYSKGHLKPTCYKTAFLIPFFFIEVPYFFYQNRKNKN